mmetsp:Transcript_4587/g.6519  ORF Transcript_4587/g.6519 Transcript_4587/m.6519 type:complete len:91 (-) Transcript_4587:2271-2543(-)
MDSEVSASFKLNPKVLLILLQTARDNMRGRMTDESELKISKPALQTLAELCRIFIISARARAEVEARDDSSESIAPEHVEAIMPELLQDF